MRLNYVYLKDLSKDLSNPIRMMLGEIVQNKEKVLKTFSQFEKEHFFKIIFTSTKTKEGIKELRRDLLQIISKNENKT